MKGRKTGSKLISLILALVMIVTLLPATAMAAPEIPEQRTIPSRWSGKIFREVHITSVHSLWRLMENM